MVDEAFRSADDTRLVLTAGVAATRLGEQVRSWRMEAGISEAELAGALKLSPGEVGSAERGEARFTPEQIVTICEAFSVSPSRLLQAIV